MKRIGTDWDNKVWYARKRGAMHIWVGRIAAFQRLEDLGAVCKPNTGGRLILTGMVVSLDSRYNGFSVRSRKLLGYFMIIMGSEAPLRFVYESSYKFVSHPNNKLEKFVNTLSCKRSISPNSIFTGNGSLQQSGGGCRNVNVYATMCISHMRRITCPTRLNSYTAVVWVWIQRMPLKLQRVLRKEKNRKLRKIPMIPNILSGGK